MCTHQAHNRHTHGTSTNGEAGVAPKFIAKNMIFDISWPNFAGNDAAVFLSRGAPMETVRKDFVHTFTFFKLARVSEVPASLINHTKVVLIIWRKSGESGGDSSFSIVCAMCVPVMCLMCVHTWDVYNSKVWT